MDLLEARMVPGVRSPTSPSSALVGSAAGVELLGDEVSLLTVISLASNPQLSALEAEDPPHMSSHSSLVHCDDHRPAISITILENYKRFSDEDLIFLLLEERGEQERTKTL